MQDEVGAGVVDCPIHSSAIEQAPSNNRNKDIVKDNGAFAMVRMVKNVSVDFRTSDGEEIKRFWVKKKALIYGMAAVG